MYRRTATGFTTSEYELECGHLVPDEVYGYDSAGNRNQMIPRKNFRLILCPQCKQIPHPVTNPDAWAARPLPRYIEND